MGERVTSKKVATGEVLFREGDYGDCAYIINKGRIEIYVGEGSDQTAISVLGVGEIFGEMSILDDAPRSASAVALEECELSLVSRDQVTSRVDQADPIVRFLIFFLLKRMRTKNVISGGSPRVFNSLQEVTDIEQANNQAVLDKIRFEGELLSALEKNDFHLHFQPIVRLKNAEICGFEALIRWNSADRGMVRPDVFMGVAEESSLIVPIGLWVLKKACAELARLREEIYQATQERPELFMGVNVSAKQFADPAFFRHLEEVPGQYGVDPKDIKLEITERVLLQGSTVNHWIDRCRSLGFPIALDDFGTGYSSLSYLEQFEVDVLKIDQSFIRRMVEHERAAVIVQAMTSLAAGLKLPVVAEGIETADQARQLIDLNCEFGQGYFFGRPVTMDVAIQGMIKQVQGQKQKSLPKAKAIRGK